MKTFFAAIIVTILTFALHEGAHLIAAKALGYDAEIGFNQVRALSPTGTIARGDAMLIAAAGPAVTLLQGLAAFGWAMMGRSLFAFNILFVATFFRMLAVAVSLANPNDEMRISLDLGLGPWALPAAVIGLLLILTVIAFRRTEPGWKRLVLLWLGVSIAVTGTVFSDAYVPNIIL